jgi:hypothetical protein
MTWRAMTVRTMVMAMLMVVKVVARLPRCRTLARPARSVSAGLLQQMMMVMAIALAATVLG